MKKIAVIGVGNLLMKDDGVGIHALRALEEADLPDNVRLHDCSTVAFAVLEAMDRTYAAIIIDAYHHGKRPGAITVFNYDKDDFEDIPNLSMHGFTFIDALRSGGDAFDLPPVITLIGVEPENLTDIDDTLSPEVEKAIPFIVEKVKEMVGGGPPIN